MNDEQIFKSFLVYDILFIIIYTFIGFYVYYDNILILTCVGLMLLFEFPLIQYVRHSIDSKVVKNEAWYISNIQILFLYAAFRLVLVLTLFCVVIFDVSDIDLLYEMKKMPLPSIFSLFILSILFLFSMFLTIQVFLRYKVYLFEYLTYTLQVEIHNGGNITKRKDRGNLEIIKNAQSVYLVPKITENIIREVGFVVSDDENEFISY